MHFPTLDFHLIFLHYSYSGTHQTYLMLFHSDTRLGCSYLKLNTFLIMYENNDLGLGFLVLFWGLGLFLEVMGRSWFVCWVSWGFGEGRCCWV